MLAEDRFFYDPILQFDLFGERLEASRGVVI
jgi:hypothetical protein